MNPSDLLESDFDVDGFRQIHGLVEALRQENQRLRRRIRELTQENGKHVAEEPPACPHFVVHPLNGKKLYFELAVGFLINNL